MNTEKFEEVWTAQVAAEKAMLLERAEAYATNGDRLGNFYAGAVMNNTTPVRYGFGLVTKHIIALRDLVFKLSDGKGTYTEKEATKFNEYATDIRNYSVLLKALYHEERDRFTGNMCAVERGEVTAHIDETIKMYNREVVEKVKKAVSMTDG